MSLDSAAAVVKLRSLTHKFNAGVRAAKPFYPTLATVIPSDGYDEEYGLLGAVPGVREWLADRQFITPLAAKFEIVNKLWESSERIEKTRIRDDRMGLYGPRLKQMGVRAAKHPDKLLLTDLIPNAATGLAFDGQTFFDTDHAWGASGAQSNLLTQDITTPADPTLDEFQDALDAALNAMFGFVDDSGELMHDDVIIENGVDMELLILAPLKFRRVAIQATTAGILVGNGATNIVITNARVVATPRLTGNSFDLYRTDTEFKPFIFQAREPITTGMKGWDDMEFKDVKFMAQARYNLGYGAWWNAVRVNFT